MSRVRDGESPEIEVVGIGAVLTAKDDALSIEQLIDGGGAQEAGFIVHDEITAIDGRTVVALGFQTAIESIRGVEGSIVTLTMRRAGGEERDVAVRRRKVRAP
jgi:C-terminal processing protease CtpA/Prc